MEYFPFNYKYNYLKILLDTVRIVLMSFIIYPWSRVTAYDSNITSHSRAHFLYAHSIYGTIKFSECIAYNNDLSKVLHINLNYSQVRENI